VYDQLTARYSFPCPTAAEVRVRLSAFRTIERLPGTSRPSIYEIRFECPCGSEHAGLATHRDLDWAPLGHVATAFYNLMTGRLEPAAAPLADEAAWRIGQGRWPWTFFCAAEARPRAVYPSAFRQLVPERGRIVVAITCPECARTSANAVSHDHLDVPFYSDQEVEVGDRVYPEGDGPRELAADLATGSVGWRTTSLA
jgi:hypothetical protein